MKKAFTSILAIPFVLMLAAGCVKKPADVTKQIIIPYGKFQGLFSRIRFNKNLNKLDTVKANLILNLDAKFNAYQVTGDTAVVHAGSKGTYSVDAAAIAFSDATLATADGIKVHLNGAYRYNFDGTIFDMQYVSGDTLKFIYHMKVY